MHAEFDDDDSNDDNDDDDDDEEEEEEEEEDNDDHLLLGQIGDFRMSNNTPKKHMCPMQPQNRP